MFDKNTGEIRHNKSRNKNFTFDYYTRSFKRQLVKIGTCVANYSAERGGKFQKN